MLIWAWVAASAIATFIVILITVSLDEVFSRRRSIRSFRRAWQSDNYEVYADYKFHDRLHIVFTDSAKFGSIWTNQNGVPITDIWMSNLTHGAWEYPPSGAVSIYPRPDHPVCDITKQIATMRKLSDFQNGQE